MRRSKTYRKRARVKGPTKMASEGYFRATCEKHGVPGTRRQESKFRNGYGALYRAING